MKQISKYLNTKGVSFELLLSHCNQAIDYNGFYSYHYVHELCYISFSLLFTCNAIRNLQLIMGTFIFFMKCSFTQTVPNKIFPCVFLNMCGLHQVTNDAVLNTQLQSKVPEFLALVGNTVVSYLSTYGSDAPEDNSEDAQFVLSLCGTVTSESPAISLSNHRKSKSVNKKIITYLL